MNLVKKYLANINSFKDYVSLSSSLNENDKGNLFEELTYLILKTRPEYVSIIKNVWFRKEVPTLIREKINLPNTDEGIDLIAETINGEYWAIQCKYKGQFNSPTYKEISTFTSLSNIHCKNISLALLVHSGEKGVKKKKLLGSIYSEIGLNFWLGLDSEDWNRIHKKIKNESAKPTPRKPRPHQEKAIHFAKSHYLKSKHQRGRLIMPCGTGKSLTAFWIANSLRSESVIIAVPSLTLIKQSLEDWTKEFIALDEYPKPQWLVICSDESTSKLDNDEFLNDTYSLGIPTTTKINVIVDFLRGSHKGRKIIFTTYQSSDKLAKAARISKFQFDLAILDESHKTVGEKSKTFSILLSDLNISIKKRMFMTATERIIKGNNDNVFSMDNDAIYGKQFYQLSFKDAINSIPPIICDYKILTITISNDEIRKVVNLNNLLTDKSRNVEEQEAQAIAAAIALRKATSNYGIKHVVSYHRSIKSSLEFAILNNKFNDSNLDGIKLISFHISSKKTAGERVKLISDFKSETLALITNARCLTEGVDIPAIDCVLFADPKQSITDIVQGAGRALRPYEGKNIGYIMIPLIVPDEMNIDEFAESTPFRKVAKIIGALSTQDERIVEEFRIINSGKKFTGKKIVIEGTVPIGLNIDFSKMAGMINSRIWKIVGKLNWREFNEARMYVRLLNIKSVIDWNKYCKSEIKPPDIPSFPNQVYLNNWISWGDWLGNSQIAHKKREFKSFNSARNFVHSLYFKSGLEFTRFCKSKDKPQDIPSHPERVYKEWKGMGDWLGTGAIANFKKKYRKFEDARSYVHTLNIKSRYQWTQFCKNDKPVDIPSTPSRTYKNNGWNGWGDWFGTSTIANNKKMYRSFESARSYVHTLHLKNRFEWTQYCKTDKPADIPSYPNETYKNSGWRNLADWLGKHE